MQKRLSERNITIELTDEAKAWLLKEGYDPAFGARPLRRAIQRNVENPLSNRILSGEVKDGAHIKVTVGDTGLNFSTGTGSGTSTRKKAKAAAS